VVDETVDYPGEMMPLQAAFPLGKSSNIMLNFSVCLEHYLFDETTQLNHVNVVGLGRLAVHLFVTWLPVGKNGIA
jgi:hypothetical protein